MASQKGDWKKTWSTGILLPKETKTIDKHVRRQINRTREKGVTLPSHVLWKTNWPSKETGLEISYKTGYGKGIKMEADWRNAKERHDAVGAGRGSWNLQGETRRPGHRRGNWKGHCSSDITVQKPASV